MSRLSWGNAPDRLYEIGVDQGVLYLDSHFEGIPWNGLTAVRELPTGGEIAPYYVDGFKYANISSAEDYAATIEAFTAPSEFAVCDGSTQPFPGLVATQQRRSKFGFSYRTRIGDAAVGENKGYKINLVYNALAGPSQKDRQTMGSENVPMSLSWPISTQPIKFPGIRPTSHFVIDSTKTDSIILALLEARVYGADNIFSTLPSAEDLVSIFMANPQFLGEPYSVEHPVRLLGISDDIMNLHELSGTVGDMWYGLDPTSAPTCGLFTMPPPQLEIYEPTWIYFTIDYMF